MKKLFCFAVVLCVTAALVIGTAAATVYVQTGATGSGASAADAVGTVANAIKALDGKGGTILLCDAVTVSGNITIPEQAGDLVIKSAEGKNGSLSMNGTLTLGKNENANTFIFDLPVTTDADGITVFGGFNSVHFTKSFTVNGKVDFYGGVSAEQAPSNTTTGKVEEKWAMNVAATTELPYTVTVDNGNFGAFAGGNYRSGPTCVIGSIAAPLDIVINGGTFTAEVDFTADSPLKTAEAFSISGMSILADDATLTINGGTFNTPIYAVGYLGETTTTASASSQLTNSDKKYYATDGDIAITVNSGTLNGCEINAYQNAASYNRLLRGNYMLTIGAGATLASGMVLDATQVKAYDGVTDKKATLIYPANKTLTVKRFDTVNGAAKTYDEPIRIACVGDSITQGTGAKVGGVTDYAGSAYPAQLYKKAVGEGKDVIVSNYGCGATKVMDYGGLWYNAGLAYTLSMEETDADYILVGLGTNDAGCAGNTHTQAIRFGEQYKEFIRAYAALPETDMVYGTSAIYRYRIDVAAVSVIRAQQAKALRDLAAEGEKATYVDLYALTLEDALNYKLLSSDALHPHTAGYTIYADVLYDAVFSGVTEVEDFYMKDLYVASAAYGGRRAGKGTKEDPTDTLSVAFAKADPSGATIHIIGEYVYDKFKLDSNQHYYGFNTPYHVEKLTIVGERVTTEKDGVKTTVEPSLMINSKLFFINSDMEFKNIKLGYSDSKGGVAMYTSLGYHNVTFDETFSTLGNANMMLYAGYLVFNDAVTTSRYSAAEYDSSDADCIITVNGGDYLYIIGGNLHWSGYTSVPYGTYSGNMTLNIGKNVTMKSTTAGINGVCGMNYLTGTITANIGGWHANKPIRDYAVIGYKSKYMETYDESKNTGTVTVNLTDGLERELTVMGDFNGDGKVTFADTMLLAKYYAEGMDTSKSVNFYDRKEVTFVQMQRALRMAAQ